MLTSLQLTNFRQFEELTIEPLARVNLIAGSNGTGKTSILEALYLLFAELRSLDKFPSIFRSHLGDRNNRNSFWEWLRFKKRFSFEIKAASSGSWCFVVDFHQQTQGVKFGIRWKEVHDDRLDFYQDLSDLDPSARWAITGLGPSRESGVWPSVTPFPTFQGDPYEDAEIYNQVIVKRRGKERLTELLQIVEPRLSKLEYVKLDTPEPVIYAELDMDDLIPATQLGQGFSRLLRIFSGILASEAKIVLIDEIENGLHWTALEQVWRGIAELTRQQDVQIFATTHSLECIRAAHNVFVQLSNGNGYGDGFALHRLDRKKDGGVKVVTYDQETLQTSFEQNWEVR